MMVYKLTLRSEETGKMADPTPETDADGEVVTYKTSASASLAAHRLTCATGRVVVPQALEVRRG